VTLRRFCVIGYPTREDDVGGMEFEAVATDVDEARRLVIKLPNVRRIGATWDAGPDTRERGVYASHAIEGAG
jgi:hypothetical protein